MTRTYQPQLWLPVAAFIVFACFVTVDSTVQAQGTLLHAGAATVDITPQKFPISVNGGMRDVQATRANDPLHARCIVLAHGETQIAICVCDSCMIPREILDAAKERASKATGIPTGRMLISATHCHSAPTLGGVFQSEPEQEYSEYLTGKIAEAVAKAHGRLAPAKIGWGVGQNDKQVFNRRWLMKEGTELKDPFGRTTDKVKMNPGHSPALDRPAGPTDPEICFLSLQTREGRPLALLSNYSLHYVGGVPANTVSGDYFGEFALQMARRLGVGQNAFVGIMSNGTSGNINNIDYSQPSLPRREPLERIREVAASVADATYKKLQTVKYHDRAVLSMAEREIELSVRLPSEDDVARAKQLLAEAGDPPYSKIEHIYARETVLLAKYPATVKVKLQAIRVGDVGICSSPCETFVETGLAIKKESPLKPTFTIELANGYSGYLPTPEHHELGGYETWRARSSYLAADAEPKLRATLLELLKEVAK